MSVPVFAGPRGSRRQRRRAREEAELEEEEAGGVGDIPEAPVKSQKEKTWKSVEMDYELLKEFESYGGVFIEEADDDDAGVTYGDGRTWTASAKGKTVRKKGRKRQKLAEEAGEEPDLKSENERLRKELEAIKGQLGQQKEEDAPEPDLPGWIQFELHPALMRGLARLGFQTPTSVQARCLVPAIRQRKDIVGAAETGSGKTLAFGLPILHHTLGALGTSVSDTTEVSEKEPAAVAGPASPGLRALILLPTRELAVQVQGHINAVAQGTPIRTVCVVGGLSIEKQKRLLGRHPAVVVGTPGRLSALLGLGKEAHEERCDWFREGLKGLRHLVLDEADRLVESGHFKELDAILKLVYESLQRPQQLQTFVFSATLTLSPGASKFRGRKKSQDEGSKVDSLMERLRFREARAVHTVDLTRAEKEAEPKTAAESGSKADATREKPAVAQGARLPEGLQLVEGVCKDDREKEVLLAMWLLRRYRWDAPDSGHPAALPSSVRRDTAVATGGRVLVFVNAISSVLRLSSVLALLLESPSAAKVLSKVRMGKGKDTNAPGLCVQVLGLHSRMRQKDRLKRMEKFRTSAHALMVCTDVAARGLDVKQVGAVLHYQAPRGVEVFVHRSGRTARAGTKGDSVSFMSPTDADQWNRVYRAAGVAKEQLKDVGQTASELAAAREAIGLAVDLESKVHRTAKKEGEKSWLRRTADEAELMLDEDEDDKDRGHSAAPRHALWGLYRQLQARVRRPPRRQGGGPLPRSKRRRR